LLPGIGPKLLGPPVVRGVVHWLKDVADPDFCRKAVKKTVEPRSDRLMAKMITGTDLWKVNRAAVSRVPSANRCNVWLWH
jgi:hypothetical protein